MSFETITIERRQPILNKKYVRAPDGVNDSLPLVTVDEAVTGINNPTAAGREKVDLLNFGFGERRGFLPTYQRHNNLDFLTYAAVGLDGKTVGAPAGPVDDIQQELRDIAESKF